MKKEKWSYILLTVLLLVGVLLVIYPSAANYYNSHFASRAIGTYMGEVENLNEADYDKILQKAYDYNKQLAASGGSTSLSKSLQEQYSEQLRVSVSTQVMGYIDIPAIRCNLPIYHGTDERTLEVGVGHLEWTSLPVGGSSTHAVLSAHRGLPSAQLFTKLDRLVVGDVFTIHVLDETLTYEVDKILIVEPQDVSALKVEPDEDLVTLVTCTPYGVNSHRLLVRGHRIENLQNGTVFADAIQVEPLVVAPIVGIPILIVLLALLVEQDKRRMANRFDS